MKYRLYIDETGNADLSSSADVNHRFLSLTGVIVELSYADAVLFPKMEMLKRTFFGSHVDEPIVLHRKEMVNRLPPFTALRDEQTRQRFDAEMLNIISEFDYRVLTVIMDKQAHLQHYATWRFDPYHYCLTVMVERYVLWLRRQDARGDVMAESRGGKEDLRLKQSFRRVVSQGTSFIGSEVFKDNLTSVELKVKQKSSNIAGLQLADMLAHPCFRSALVARSGTPMPATFGAKIVAILEATKYIRSPDGALEGWGIKWLP